MLRFKRKMTLQDECSQKCHILHTFYPTPAPPLLLGLPLILLPTRPFSSICSLFCFLSFFHCRASQEALVGKNQPLATAASLVHKPSLYHYRVPEVSHLVFLRPPPSLFRSLSCLHSCSPRGAGSKGWRFTLIAAWLQASPGQSNFGASVCWM